MIRFIAKGGSESFCEDLVSLGYMWPSIDFQKDVECFVEAKENRVKFTAKRLLDTGTDNDNSEDYLLPVDSEFMIGWSFNHKTNDTK